MKPEEDALELYGLGRAPGPARGLLGLGGGGRGGDSSINFHL